MKSKFNFLTAALTLTGATVFAQVGIGTSTPNASSILELQASDKGLLLPRVALTDVNLAAPLSTHVQGMVVYNTTATIAGHVGNAEGIWRNDGTKWLKGSGVGTSSTGSDWSLTGNAGTTVGTNFIGTTDAQDLMFKVDNTPSGRINIDKENTSLGYGSNNSGGGNTAIGFNALSINTNGSNVAVGSRVLEASTNAKYNVGLGYNALKLSTGGSGNIAVGAYAGDAITTGSENIIIGGSQDTPTATTNRFLNIGGAIFGTGLTGNQLAPAGNIGIGKVAPAEKLDVAGSFHNQTQLTTSGRYTGVYSGINAFGAGLETTALYNITNPTLGAGDLLNYVTVQDDHVQMGTTEDVAGLVGSNSHIASYPGELHLVADNNDLDNFSYFHLRPIDKGKTYWNSVQDPTGTNNSTTIDFDAASSIAFKFSTAGVYSEYRFPRTDGTANQVLKTDGLGNLSWGSAGGGGDLTNDAFINNAGSTRVELGTQSDGSTARTAGTEFVITDAGRVGIGTVSPLTQIHVVATSSSGARGIASVQHSSDTIPARISLAKSRGTEAAPVAAQTSDILGDLRFAGYTGSTYNAGARIEAVAAASFTAVETPANLDFYTNPLGSLTQIRRMRIADTGNVGIGISGSTSPTAKVQIEQDPAVTTQSMPTVRVGGLSTSNETSIGFEWLGGLSTTQPRWIAGRGYNSFRFDIRTFDGTTDTARLSITPTGNIGIGSLSPSVRLEVGGTDAIRVPVGTTAQRPTAAFGQIRYNSTIGRGEMYVNDINGDGTQGDAGWRAF
jgi:hypothetical protein